MSNGCAEIDNEYRWVNKKCTDMDKEAARVLFSLEVRFERSMTPEGNVEITIGHKRHQMIT